MKSVAIPMEGHVFGRLTVLERAGSDPVTRGALWRCRWECGRETVAQGTALRKGNRRSCGCRNPHLSKHSQEDSVTKTKAGIRTEIRTAMSETTRWVIEESDGTRFLLRRLGGARTAVVDHDGERWACSEDGPQQGRRGSASNQCAHVQVVGRSLSMSMAQTIADRLVNKDVKRPLITKADVEQAAEPRTEADIIAAGAPIRAKRARQHDEQFQGVTGEVVVRQMTDEDRRKLQERRARKARSFVTSDGYAGRFQG